MRWFLFAFLTTIAWGIADLFYKKGADESDKYSHLKTSIMVGLVMGIHAIYTLITKDLNYNFMNVLVYLPVSLMYILSMVIGYFGLRYLELSISSPVQNSSGAVVSLMCLIFLGDTLINDSLANIHPWLPLLPLVGVLLICIGVIALGVVEKKESDKLTENGDRKYKIGFIAFMMPILYCIIDAMGTFFDAYYLDDIASTPLLNVTEATFEDVANVSYELTFLICAIILFVLLMFKKQTMAPKLQGNRLAAAIFETAGQFCYVHVIGGNAVVAAPMIAAYCVVSMILSRIFLKEKLNLAQYITIFIVIAGIILLGISDGLAGEI